MSAADHPSGTRAPAETAPPGLAPYERLAELAEAELAACEAERPEDLADLYAEAHTIRASLPGRPPAEAEAAAAQARTGKLLGAHLAERNGTLERVHRARKAAHAYATTANARAIALQLLWSPWRPQKLQRDPGAGRWDVPGVFVTNSRGAQAARGRRGPSATIRWRPARVRAPTRPR